MERRRRMTKQKVAVRYIGLPSIFVIVTSSDEVVIEFEGGFN
jgi:hypothetical protein